MLYYLWIAVGGAVGAMARYGLMNLVDGLSESRFPLGTLVVNLIGSILIGVFFVLISERFVLSQEMRALLVVGFVGAFTTFSTFSLDALLLLQYGYILQALAYILASVVLCLLGVWAGMGLMRAL